MAEAPFSLLLRNCRVATMAAGARAPYGAVLDAAVGVVGERIAFVGPAAAVPARSVAATTDVVDLGGRWVTPGLIDCHTHVVYGGDRSGEWELKLEGATPAAARPPSGSVGTRSSKGEPAKGPRRRYEEVALAGGGIVNTVGGTRAAGVDGLVAAATPRVRAMLQSGAGAGVEERQGTRRIRRPSTTSEARVSTNGENDPPPRR